MRESSKLAVVVEDTSAQTVGFDLGYFADDLFAAFGRERPKARRPQYVRKQ